jgi:hypothetical protein
VILGIMQPYFFPYLGYFDLIHYSSHWVVFDTVQYIRHGWISRNRILHPTQGWQYILVPVQKHARETQIKDVKITHDPGWRQRIQGQLQHYRKKAPFFQAVFELVSECLTIQEPALSRYNVQVLGHICRYLGIHFDYSFFSDMQFNLGPITGPGDWALRISAALGANEYANPPGGAHLFDRTHFEEMGITLTIRNLPVLEYPCAGYMFEPNLSIIDVLMWNSPKTVMNFLEKHWGASAAADHADLSG